MKTSTMTRPPAYSIPAPKWYGITEKKKAELDNLLIQVIDAQHEVEQYQAIVTSLTQKSANFQGFLAVADSNRTQAGNNKTLIDNLVQNALDLKNNSDVAFDEMVLADAKTKELASKIKIVMDKLIYSAGVLNRLSNIIIRQKAMNPLISDELVSMVSTAGKDANNAVALTLVALQSTFAAEASNMEAESALALEYSQAIAFYQTLTGAVTLSSNAQANTEQKAENKQIAAASLKGLLYKAYHDAKSYYKRTDKACIIITKQLNEAVTALNTAQVKLKSLQAGLAAANAAAMAS
jgi:hypothetical protein